MKILFVSNLYPPNTVGGYERLCFDVAESFAAKGHEVSVLTSCHGRRVSRPPGQLVHQALQMLVGDAVYEGFPGSDNQRRAINRSNITALDRVIADVKPDKIFCWNLYGFDRSLFDRMVEGGVPVVLMLTDNWLADLLRPDFVARYFKEEVFSTARTHPRRIPDTHGDLSFACDAIFGSRYMKKFYQDAGLSFARGEVIHNGVRRIASPDAMVRDRRTLVEDGVFKMLFAGRLVSLKGLRTAVEALPSLNHGGRHTHRVALTVVGDDRDTGYISEIRALVGRLGVEGDVTFRPPVAERDLFSLFEAHDAYVFPSLYEPFSLTLILALASGIPTLASDVGGNVEIVRHGETGLIFRKGDAGDLAGAAQRLIDDPRLRSTLSAGGRKIAAAFTFDAMVEDMQRFLSRDTE